jgi:hypothetical protein
MQSIPDDVAHTVLAPFLTLRDIRSMTSVSTRQYADWSDLNQILPDLRHCYCSYQGCANRAYIHATLDPFLAYRQTTSIRHMYSLIMNILVGLLVTPIYLIPTARIFIVALYARESLESAIDSYDRIEEMISVVTQTRSIICTCTQSIEKSYCTERHRGCLTCSVRTTPTRTLPMSFACCFASVCGLFCFLVLRQVVGASQQVIRSMCTVHSLSDSGT